ncbi:MAG TPA: toxin-antitoxin system YwqK family antitoxin, partial [Bacteroidia bacterium]|nr:toxin-antitoxin system YwqK family antitoxin [Bacteroidia bacterium]
FAQQEQYGLPEFDYQVKHDLKDSGSFDERHLRNGLWEEYKIDSADKITYIQGMDQGNSSYPPYHVVIIRSFGHYKNGYREGEWRIYKSYDYSAPYHWDLQEILNYKKGQFVGAWHYYSKTGKVIAESNYKDGNQNGAYKKYYPNGKLEKIVPMKNGVVEGVIKMYNDKGILLFDGKVKNNYYEGVQHYYHTNGKIFTTRIYKYGILWQVKELKDRNGNPLDPGTYNEGEGILNVYNEFGARIFTAEYKRGLKNGKGTEYWTNGNIRREFKAVNDTINGIEKSYDINGHLQFESRVVDGIYQGSKKFYYPNGKLWGEWQMKNGMVWNELSLVDTLGKPLDFGNFKNGNGLLINYSDSCFRDFSCEYKDGIRNGKYTEYYPDGKVSAEFDYVDGEMNGMAKYYNEKGILIQSAQMKNGLIEGHFRTFHDNGKLYYEAFFVRGIMWNIISMSDSSGHPLDFGSFKNGNGILKTYSADGALLKTYTYVDGLLNGKTEGYYPSGKLKMEYTYVNDTIEGTYKTYFENGTLREQKEVYHGLNDGTYIRYHSNGKIWTTRTYVDGLTWSVEVNNDMNGNPRDIGTIKDGNGTMIRYDENEKVIYTYQVV